MDKKKIEIGKILSFPIHKMRPSNKTVSQQKSIIGRFNFEIEQRKTLLSASIISILFVVSLVNNQLLPEQNTDSLTAQQNQVQKREVRGLASPNPAVETKVDDVVASLSQPQLGRDVILGQKPDPVEKLSFGVLEGKYAFDLTAGKVTGIEYVKSDKLTTQPQKISDRKDFLVSNRAILSAKFSKVNQINKVDAKLSPHQETFELLNDGNQPVARASFEMDAQGRFLSLKITGIQDMAAY